MKRRLLLLFVVIVALGLSGLGTQRAFAAGEVVTGTCSSISISGTVPGGPPGDPLSVVVFNGATIVASGTFTMGPGGAYSVTVAIPAPPPPSTVLRVDVYTPPPVAYVFTTNFTCQNTPSASGTGAVTFFNPNDGRVAPQAGDRLAIWCNTSGDAPNLLIYGVASDSKGLFLTTVNFADLLKAGNPRYAELKAKLAKLLGQSNADPVEIKKLMAEYLSNEGLNILTKKLGGNGTLTISVDADNNFWISWTGGPYGANGQEVWAKSFKCDFKR